MREKLNENQTAQIALIAVLALIVGYLVLTHLGGGSSEAASVPAGEGESATVSVSVETPEGTASVSGTVEAAPAAATSAATAPAGRPLPKKIERAYGDGETIALLVYRPGGIDDRKVTEASSVLAGRAGVAYFPVPVDKVARYSAITGPLGLSSAPALIVLRPRHLNGGGPAPATVTYGFQSKQDIKQAVIDAGYHGPELTYAP
jgi:hypothetical protein